MCRKFFAVDVISRIYNSDVGFLFVTCVTAKEHGIKQVGSFQCLNGKVNLSTHEAENTLREWEEQLESLKEQLSVRYERTVAQQFQRRLTSTQLVM